MKKPRSFGAFFFAPAIFVMNPPTEAEPSGIESPLRHVQIDPDLHQRVHLGDKGIETSRNPPYIVLSRTLPDSRRIDEQRKNIRHKKQTDPPGDRRRKTHHGQPA